jgi:Tfp pilus assembly protein FimT
MGPLRRGKVFLLRAFTLIEMIVLIIIIAVLSSVAVPRYARFQARVRFEGTVQKVVNFLTWAREMAQEQGVEMVVQFDPQSETFTALLQQVEDLADMPIALQDAQGTPLPPQPRTLTLREEVSVAEFAIDERATSTGLLHSFHNGRNEIRFHEDGSADSARILLRSIDGYEALLEVVPLTGRVVVTDAAE